MKSVLIIEDEIFIAMELERILETAGYSVVAIAADRAQALSAAPNADVSLVDLNLRDGPTGPELARELAEKYGVRIVYVTANPAQIGQPAPTAVGVVRKPFTEKAVLAAVALAAELEADPDGIAEIIPLPSASDGKPQPGSAG